MKVRCEDENTGLQHKKLKVRHLHPNKVFIFSGKHLSEARGENKVEVIQNTIQ